MARISLRDYNREIEELVDSGRTDEAIAHCRYILESYPKHVSTYRSLGKALLESQRYGDSADVFKRVLSCIPDDFISHLGMSIIREDEGDLDGSIWHMERAFEVQPSNAAVQSELRRLYGRRDGMAPAKVQLTRGAMARMSAKSNLYSQAIAELRTALADDSERPDLQALLARMYAQSGQRLAAIETCNALLGKFPYCLEANRLMVEILPSTERASEAETYRRRLEELDPYESQRSPTTETTEQVPAGAITLEHLDYLDVQSPIETTPAQPHWASSLGVSIEQAPSAEEPLPDWLSEVGESTSQIEQAASQEELAGGDIPEWMREAGWVPASEGAEENLPGFESFEEAETEPGELASAEIPEWLQGLAPAEEPAPEIPVAAETPDLSSVSPGEAILATEFVKSLADSEESVVRNEQPGETEPTSPAEESGAQEAEVMPQASPIMAESEGASILSASLAAGAALVASGDEQPEDVMEESTQPEISDEPTGEELPEWLAPVSANIGSQPESESLPDWLSPTTEESQQIEQESETPDWLPPSAAVSAAGLAEEQPSYADEELPEWLSPAEGLPTGETGAALTAAGIIAAASFESDKSTSEGEPEHEISDFPSVVAAPQGVAEWLAESAPEVPEEPTAGEIGEEEVAESISEWLAKISPEEALESIAEGSESLSTVSSEEETSLVQAEIPQWLREMESASPVESTVPAESVMEELSPMASEDFSLEAGEIPDWLKVAMAADAIEHVVEPGVVEHGLTGQPIIEGDTQPVRVRLTEVEPATDVAGEITPVESELIVEKTIAEEVVLEQTLEPSQEAIYKEELAGLAAVSALREESVTPGFESEDEAMAWLESLAARQGALEEELLTKPDERPTETPEWIQQFAEEAAEETEIPEEQALPEGSHTMVEAAAIIAAGLVAEQTFEKEESVEESVAEAPQPTEFLSKEPFTEVEQLPPDVAIEAETESAKEEGLPMVAGAAVVGSWLDEEPPKEAILTETEALEPSTTEEVELPDWLRGLESEAVAPTPEIVAGTWAPPAEFTELETVDALTEESLRLDINAASLAQLERIPGVGFIVAQSIVAYREVNGPFTSLDQLQEIPGISPETFDELKRRLEVELVSEAAPPPPSIPELAQAWQNIANGNIPAAVEQYTTFIRGKQELPEVIAEIQEALLIYPLDPLLHQTLGDAYVRADRLQEAMEAYSRAEDLLK